MSQNQAEQPAQAGPSAVARAEGLLNRTAHRIGCVAGRTRLRLQAAASAIRAEADRKEHPRATADAAPVEQAGQPATHTVAEMVDAFGQQLGSVVTTASCQAQKAAARLREEAEDIWVEARSISHRSGRPSP